MTEAQVVKRVADAVKKTSLTAVAREMSVSVSNLHDVLYGAQVPGKKILAHLGIQKVVTYKLVRA